MKFFATILSMLTLNAGYSNSMGTVFFQIYEPECPKDLL